MDILYSLFYISHWLWYCSMLTSHRVLWITALNLTTPGPGVKRAKRRLLVFKSIFPSKGHLSVRAAGPWCREVWISSEFPFSCLLLNDSFCHDLGSDLSPRCWFTKRPADCSNPEPWEEKEIQTGSQAGAVRTAQVLKYRLFGIYIYYKKLLCNFMEP